MHTTPVHLCTPPLTLFKRAVMVVREIIRTFVRKITESYMKKSSNDIVRSLFLMAAMIIIGAGSAFAQSETQSENDYFSLTKNAGTESESIKYYTTLGGAVNDADVGDKITLLKDYTISPDHVTTDIFGVRINKSITLDLNDHKITRDTKENEKYRGALISIDGATLTLVDNGADKDKMGSIENTEEYIGHAIVVGNDSKLIAIGVKIETPKRDTVDIMDDGEAEFDDCVIHGKVGINLYGKTTSSARLFSKPCRRSARKDPRPVPRPVPRPGPRPGKVNIMTSG